MSNEALNRVWTSDTSGGASHRLTLIALADMINPAGFCWAWLDTLCEKVQSVKRRQLINVLADLEARGEVWVLRRKREQGRNGVNYYVVNVGLGAAELHVAFDAAKQHARANGWIGEPDCTNEDAGLVQSSTDISASSCTNANGNSAIGYTPLVQSSTDISATEYRVLVQQTAPDPSYDPKKTQKEEPIKYISAPVPAAPPDSEPDPELVAAREATLGLVAFWEELTKRPRPDDDAQFREKWVKPFNAIWITCGRNLDAAKAKIQAVRNSILAGGGRIFDPSKLPAHVQALVDAELLPMTTALNGNGRGNGYGKPAPAKSVSTPAPGSQPVLW